MKNKLINGDCLEELKNISNKSIDVLFTDPPYGMNKKYGGGSDRKVNSEYLIKNSLKECFRVLKWDSPAIIWCKPSALDVFIEAVKDAGFKFRRVLWMYKPNDVTFPYYGWLLTSESIILASKGDLKLSRPEKYDHDCYIFNHSKGEMSKKLYHPSVKSLSVTIKLLKIISNENDVVLDPFIGSGTTAVACQILNRNWIGIENNKEYCNIVNIRLNENKPQSNLFDYSFVS